MNLSKIFLTTLLIIFSTSSLAGISGAKIIRVSEDQVSERCIDPYKDKVWLTLRSLTTSKNKGWFTEDKSVSVLINAKVQTDPMPATPISFPLMSVAKFGPGAAGQVSVPIEYSIVSGLMLTQDKIAYTGLGVEITLINLKDRNKLGSALQALDAITSSAKLPIPSSPYIQAATYLTSFANSAIQKDIEAQKDDKEIVGSIQLNFDPNGECKSGDFEKTGTKAIISSEGIKDEAGYVDIEKIDTYCFKVKLTPVFSLSAALNQDGNSCAAVLPGKFKTISNNYIGFYLNKQTISRTLGSMSSTERDRKESIERCLVNGSSSSDCKSMFPQ